MAQFSFYHLGKFSSRNYIQYLTNEAAIHRIGYNALFLKIQSQFGYNH